MALQFSKGFEFAIDNSLSNSACCFIVFGVTKTMVVFSFSACYFAFFGLCIAFLIKFILFRLSIPLFSGFALLCMLIFFYLFDKTTFAIRMITIFGLIMIIKLRKMFDLFAFGTGFCYDLVRHNFFLIRRLCLEPIVGNAPIVGSLYSKRKQRYVNS